MSLDLTGLPPSPVEIESFLADTSPEAYEKVVTRLLDSPAYGERMTWDWLDAARYADTNGYQGDNERTMWPWRDWVIKAFNKNLPFDLFTVWQVSGDLLEDATDEQTLATGFFRNHMINGEGGRIAEENRVEYVMDMAETMGTVWLGLTLNCCRCHDHKYDPLTNEDYYQIFAFFNQTPVAGSGGNAQTPPVLATPSSHQQEELDRFATRLASLDREMAEVAKQNAEGMERWQREMRRRIAKDARWKVLVPAEMFASGAALRKLADDSVLASSKNTDNDVYTVVAPLNLRRVTGLRLETLQHSSLTGGGLSRSSSGNFVLTSIDVSIVDGADSATVVSIPIESADATFQQRNHSVSYAIDDDRSTGWGVYKNGTVDGPHTAVFRFADEIVVPENASLRVVLRHESKHAKHNIGRFRLAVTNADRPNLPQVPDDLNDALMEVADRRSGDQIKLLGKAYRQSIPTYKLLQRQREQVAKRRDAVNSNIPKVMVMADRPQTRPTYVLQRGLYNKPTDVEVQAAIPGFLRGGSESAESQSSGPVTGDRATLARWLVSEQNPLTARVTVNRLWQQFFGIGLVKTAEDFGAQGEIPLQMELLDWLAAEFRDSDWDVKHMVRLITASHTYRQSSRIDPHQYRFDPANRYLARGARFRLPSWMIRDQALSASGLLSRRIGGAPVNTYQPPGVWEEASFGKKTYDRDDGEKLYRRSLYVFWRRIIAPTMFFDSASRQTCVVKVGRTNTPLQALQTLNDVTYVEAARVLAQRLVKADDSKDDRGRLNLAMNRVLARDASAEEASILLSGLDRARQQFRDAPEEALRLLMQGESRRDQTLDPIEHASWTGLCLTILNMDETLNHE